MFKNFSRRNHLDKPNYDLKYQYVPNSLRLDIFKSVIEDINTIQEYCIYRDSAVSINKESFRLYSHDQIAEYYTSDLFINLLLQIDWHEFLSVVEFFLNTNLVSHEEINKLFII